ncbi:MAG: DUF4241 domain-containing protein [Chitinophagaceae bacterium]
MSNSTFFISTICLIIVAACNDAPESEYYVKAVPGKTDNTKSIVNKNYQDTVYPSIFYTAFQSSTVVKQDDATFLFYRYDIGKLKVETGKIVACDPVVSRDASPFIYNFPVGEFPVQLAMVAYKMDRRVAFSRVVFVDSALVKWEFALHKGQVSLPIGQDSIYCYGVDAGTGLFADSLALKIFDEKESSKWEEVFVKKAEENGYRGYLYDFDGHNFATFSTGWGDGCYATYIGRDKNGTICQLLTDFGIIDWRKK